MLLAENIAIPTYFGKKYNQYCKFSETLIIKYLEECNLDRRKELSFVTKNHEDIILNRSNTSVFLRLKIY